MKSKTNNRYPKGMVVILENFNSNLNSKGLNHLNILSAFTFVIMIRDSTSLLK